MAKDQLVRRDYIRDPLRRRFSAFVGLPWFEALLDAIYIAYERSDEWSEQKILDGLIESYMLAGHADPGAECSYCSGVKIELRYEDQCNTCAEEDEVREEIQRIKEEEHECILAAMSPEDRASFEARCQQEVRFFMGGLMSRNVQ